VKKIGEKRKQFSFKLLFHDTHHRAVTERESMKAYDLSHYDGVLAFGNVIRELYLKEGWAKRAWTWHEAADTRLFKPLPANGHDGDLVWIGNWGDDERTKELFEFLIEPVKELKLKAKIYGVRYPDHAKKALADAGIEYGGWLPNFKAPEVFARYRFTAHVPRGPYVRSLTGIPTIRPFEALACGIPLLSAPWNDAEHLFTPGKDFLFAQNSAEMKELMQTVLSDKAFVSDLTQHGLHTIQQKHTCAHRVDELYQICDEVGIKNHSKTSA
jgi:spore maturation protein CgeB